ncbi:MAG: TolC family protein, partial [Gemmatimonadaceae bacterium]|nr:TolC family protein [Chitinophagaceae bacterium]
MIHPSLKMRTNNYNKYLPFLAVMLLAATVQAQNPTPAKKPYSANARPLFDTGKVVNIREKLVELAMQNPEYEIADRRIAIAHYQLAKAKGAWLGQVVFQANFNEYSIKPSGSTVGAANLFPRYNVGFSLPLDLITNKGNEVKIARQNLGMMQAEKNQRFRTIKGDVLKKYEAYLLHKQKLDLQSQSTLDAYSVFLGAEK